MFILSVPWVLGYGQTELSVLKELEELKEDVQYGWPSGIFSLSSILLCEHWQLWLIAHAVTISLRCENLSCDHIIALK